MTNERTTEPDKRTWIERDLPIARTIGRPLREFLHIQTSSGVVLMVATVAALVLANTPWGPSIHRFWETHLTLFEIGDFRLEESLVHWVNDGLMAVFFFVVGLEIKRELVTGELKDPRRAVVPMFAAVGGMIVPAAIYFALNASGAGRSGWGVPMATDIAFAVGILALLGSRVPDRLRVFVLTLAIIDDIGAILVIAIFYSKDLNLAWLAAGIGCLLLVVALQRSRVWYIPIYAVVGVITWVCFLESGVHATVAGVALGLLTPATPLRPRPKAVEVDQTSSWSAVQGVLFDVRETLPVAERLEHSINPWSAFIILPLFAFANAGIELSGDVISAALRSPVSWGVVAGLVVGKPIGVTAGVWLAERTGAGTRSEEITWGLVVGAGALAGIGFTMSLFITGLAFDNAILIDESKIGILVASIVAAGAGMFLLRRATQSVAGAGATATTEVMASDSPNGPAGEPASP